MSTTTDRSKLADEAQARLRAYKGVTCTGEKWDRMLGLLELARDHLHHVECIDSDATHCAACALEAEIDSMLEGR